MLLATTASPARRNLALTIGGTLAGTAAITVLVATHGSSIAEAATRVNFTVFLLTLAIGVVSLMLRAEVWGICLAACGGRAARSELHAANSLGMLGNAFNHYVGPVLRIGALRRIAPDRAPRPCQMAAADVPVLLTETSLLLLLLATAVGAAGLPWWLPLAAAGALGLAVSAVWRLRHRFSHRPATAGLNVMASRRHLKRMMGLIAVAIGLQVLRTALLLHGVGLDPAFWQVAMTFCATGILGVLPLGPATSSGATMAVFSAQSTAAAAAAGVVITASALAAAALYALWGALILARRAVRRPVAQIA